MGIQGWRAPPQQRGRALGELQDVCRLPRFLQGSFRAHRPPSDSSGTVAHTHFRWRRLCMQGSLALGDTPRGADATGEWRHLRVVTLRSIFSLGCFSDLIIITLVIDSKPARNDDI